MSKKKSDKWKEWVALVLTAFFAALIIGNLIAFGYGDYIVPGINLDVMTFVWILGYGSVIMLVAIMIRRRR